MCVGVCVCSHSLGCEVTKHSGVSPEGSRPDLQLDFYYYYSAQASRSEPGGSGRRSQRSTCGRVRNQRSETRWSSDTSEVNSFISSLNSSLGGGCKQTRVVN